MKRDEPTTSVTRVPTASNSTSTLLLSLADTTWRMFVPSVGLLMLGRYVDTTYATKPWGMIIGTVVGVVIAGLLVKKQLQDIQKGEA